MKTYRISFYKKEKFGEPINRTVVVKPAVKAGSKTEGAKAALDIFMNSIGNLKTYEVTSIQEIDDRGNAVGEPITPA